MPLRLLDDLDGFVNHGQIAQAEEVHLHQPDVGQVFHVVLRDDRSVVVALNWHQIFHRHIGDHDACRVHAESFVVPSSLRARSTTCFVSSLAAYDFLNSGWSATISSSGVGLPRTTGTIFASFVDSAKGYSSTRATSLMTALLVMRLNVMICATVIVTIFFRYVADDFVAALDAKVGVDIWHRLTLRIEESLKQQVVLDRIDVGDAQRVTQPGCPPQNLVPDPTGMPFARACLMKSLTIKKVGGEIHILNYFEFGACARFSPPE